MFYILDKITSGYYVPPRRDYAAFKKGNFGESDWGNGKTDMSQIVGGILCIISVPTEASERKRKHIWAKLFNKSNNVKIPLYIWLELGYS